MSSARPLRRAVRARAPPPRRLPSSADQRAFVITLGRAGEDNKSFRLTDLDSTFAGFAGADYSLQVPAPPGTQRRLLDTGGKTALPAGQSPV